jgi:hypothetical protein
MATTFDGLFWSHHFRRVLIPAIRAFERAVVDRVMPAFANIEAEAETASENEYERLGNMPSWGEYDDMSVAAGQAEDAGLAFYEEMTGVRQALLNLSAAALFHMVEQQLLYFHRRQVLRPHEEYDRKLFGRETVIARFRDGGIELHDLKSWPALHELEILANTVKHGDGRSADELRALRPDLLVRPEFRNQTGMLGRPSQYVRTPLMGDDVYVSIDDFRAFAAVAVSFWEEVADAIVAAG